VFPERQGRSCAIRQVIERQKTTPIEYQLVIDGQKLFDTPSRPWK
jgi:hypothetical protein